jgi:hypothetical protein
MGVHIEWLSGVMRLGKDFSRYGDPYEMLCGVARIGDTLAFIGASSETIASIVGEREAIRALLRPLGIKRVRWSRMRDGKEIWREFPV